MPKILNRSEAADCFRVSLQTIDEWIRLGCPAEKTGNAWQIDPASVLGWHRERERQNALGDIAKIDEQEARRRKLAAEAALVEHELALKQRAAVSIEDSAVGWGNSVSAFRARMLGIGNRLGPQVAIEPDAVTCQALIDAAVHEALQELSELKPEVPEPAGEPQGASVRSPEGSQAGGATAAADGDRVGRAKPKAERGKRG